MKNQEIINKLLNRQGKQYIYNGRHETVLNHLAEGDHVYVSTDFRTRKMRWDEAGRFLSELLPVDERKPHQIAVSDKEEPHPVVTYRASIQADTFSALRDMLMDNARKVQDDPAYIPQASAVRDNIGSVIDLAKVEVELVKTLNKLGK